MSSASTSLRHSRTLAAGRATRIASARNVRPSAKALGHTDGQPSRDTALSIANTPERTSRVRLRIQHWILEREPRAERDDEAVDG